MKSNKNNLQILVLLIAAVSLIISLFAILMNENGFSNINFSDSAAMAALTAAVSCVAAVMAEYIIIIIKRINPKQYIYVSFSRGDTATVNTIIMLLDEELNRLSKYRFEILTADTIPFGSDMYKTMHEYLQKATVVVVIVSEDYILSKWCNEEFIELCNTEKRIIPIVTDSYNYLSKLPKDISNIKALLLTDCESDKDIKQKIKLLAKDLVRQRKD